MALVEAFSIHGNNMIFSMARKCHTIQSKSFCKSAYLVEHPARQRVPRRGGEEGGGAEA